MLASVLFLTSLDRSFPYRCSRIISAGKCIISYISRSFLYRAIALSVRASVLFLTSLDRSFQYGCNRIISAGKCIISYISRSFLYRCNRITSAGKCIISYISRSFLYRAIALSVLASVLFLTSLDPFCIVQSHYQCWQVYYYLHL